jgi:flagellar hook-basal body complex protein FliE
MPINALDAVSAYGRATKISNAAALPSASPMDHAAGSAGPDFGGMVETMVTDTASALRGAEQASVKQVAGKGDMIDVVTAIGAAESALHTVVAVRDRVIGAYNDIMHMQI